MARDKGLLNISANFEPQTAQPFDARMRVQTLADLTNATQWEANDGTVYAYIGMITVVYNDTTNNGLYRLEQEDYTNISNWSKVGDGGSAGSVDWSNIEGDITQNTDLQDSLSLKEDTANKNQANGYVGLDANAKIDISHIPNSALERLIIVASETARFALTTTVAQNGDVVKQQDTDTMFYIVDDTNLNNASGYEEFAVGTAGAVEWSNILNKPIDMFHTETNTTDDITEGNTNLFDKEVAFTGGNNVTITGTYPNFEIQDNTMSPTTHDDLEGVEIAGQTTTYGHIDSTVKTPVSDIEIIGGTTGDLVDQLSLKTTLQNIEDTLGGLKTRLSSVTSGSQLIETMDFTINFATKIEYALYRLGGGYRTGVVKVLTNGTEYTISDNVDGEIGNTSDLTFTASLSGTDCLIYITNSGGYSYEVGYNKNSIGY